jgi:cell division protein FtsA
MSEILDFVTYHLKQVGMDNKQLNGGIILTGGGSQLKHLIQLTEYQTGLNARIGYPNEHLSTGYIEELTKPMYATCIGLILKGYSDFERKKKEFVTSNTEINIPAQFKMPEVVMVETETSTEVVAPPVMEHRQRSIWDKLKDSIYDIFKEEDDAELK